MTTNINKEIEQKLVRFLEKHWELNWFDPTKLAQLKLGVLADRDIKLELIGNVVCGDQNTKFKELVLNTLQSNWGNFSVVVDESVDDYYCEFELLKQKPIEQRLYEPEQAVNHKNTLEDFKGYKSERYCGNTTRLVDHAVQIIMSGKVCHILDHYRMGKAPHANSMLAHKVMLRLNNEFGHLQFKYDPFKNTISFKNVIDV